MARRGRLRSAQPLMRIGDVLSVLLYGAVALVAIWKSLPDDLGIGLRPLELEGLFVGGLLLIGVTLAAALFVTTGPQVSGRDAQPPRT